MVRTYVPTLYNEVIKVLNLHYLILNLIVAILGV